MKIKSKILKLADFGRISLLLSVCVFVAGCGALGYRLGSTLPPDIRSVFIPTFVNATKEPQIEITATSQTIQAFRKDGSLSIADENTADTRLQVELVSYELVPISYEKERAKAGSEYRLTIGAKVILKDVLSSKVIVQTEVFGDTTFILSGDMATAKARALPGATADLAHDIVESVVEYW